MAKSETKSLSSSHPATLEDSYPTTAYYKVNYTPNNKNSSRNEDTKNFQKQYFTADKYSNSAVSLAIEEGDIAKLKEIYPFTELEKNFDTANLYRTVAEDMTIKQNNIDEVAAKRIYAEALHQLTLLGEDISDIVDLYDFS